MSLETIYIIHKSGSITILQRPKDISMQIKKKLKKSKKMGEEERLTGRHECVDHKNSALRMTAEKMMEEAEVNSIHRVLKRQMFPELRTSAGDGGSEKGEAGDAHTHTSPSTKTSLKKKPSRQVSRQVGSEY